MIFILEGNECTGKSTLAKRLSKQLNLEIVKMDKPKSLPEAKKMYDFYVKLVQLKDDFILDRCWISELVYGDIMPDRTGSILSTFQTYELDAMYAAKGAILIHCKSDMHFLAERFTGRGDDYVTDVDTLYVINQTYERLITRTKMTTLTHCIDEPKVFL